MTRRSCGEGLWFESSSWETGLQGSWSNFQELEEGSGNEDYNEVASIVPTRPIDSIPDRTKVPEFSPIYPSYYDPNREAGTVTEKIPNQAPYVQTKLKKYQVVAGKSFR